MTEKKRKGDIGVVCAIAALTQQGWNVSLPITEHAKYDLIIENQNKCYTVQVRYTTPNKGVLRIKLKNSWADKNGNHTTIRKKGDYDILASFDSESKICYFLNDKDFENSTYISLRLDNSKKEVENVRYAKDYLICSV